MYRGIPPEGYLPSTVHVAAGSRLPLEFEGGDAGWKGVHMGAQGCPGSGVRRKPRRYRSLWSRPWPLQRRLTCSYIHALHWSPGVWWGTNATNAHPGGSSGTASPLAAWARAWLCMPSANGHAKGPACHPGGSAEECHNGCVHLCCLQVGRWQTWQPGESQVNVVVTKGRSQCGD